MGDLMRQKKIWIFRNMERIFPESALKEFENAIHNCESCRRVPSGLMYGSQHNGEIIVRIFAEVARIKPQNFVGFDCVLQRGIFVETEVVDINGHNRFVTNVRIKTSHEKCEVLCR